MTHPAVYQDAWARALTVCQTLDIDLRDALTQDIENHETLWVLFETDSSTDDRIGLGSELYQETGQIWLHLFAPRGAGALTYIQKQTALSGAFRQATTLPGLVYLSHHTDPPDTNETGNWACFSLAIDYQFQTKFI